MNYPEHEKLKKIQDQSQICGEFLEWLNSEYEIVLCQSRGKLDLYYPCSQSREKLLAEFFDIDLDKLETEKRQMLEEMRKN
jgi:hypothetical protein